MSFSFENNSNEVIQKMEDMYQSMTKRKRNHKETRLVAVNHSFHYEIKLFFKTEINRHCPNFMRDTLRNIYVKCGGSTFVNKTND